MENMGRIYGEKVAINHQNVKRFYDMRAEKIGNMQNPYQAVLLNDHNPELIEKRIKIEDGLIFPKLCIGKTSTVLDIGCGIGRWGDKIIPLCLNGSYTGVDFSRKMIEVAIKRSSRFKTKNFQFYGMSFQEFVLQTDNARKYSHIIISGVLMYISDDNLSECLKSLLKFTDSECAVYISEPCNITERLTLKDFPSEALKSDYNVIYRTANEYNEFFSVFAEAGFSVSYSEFYSKLSEYVAFGETDRLYVVFKSQ